MIQEFLWSFGLNENEIRVYIHLLSRGSTIASMISKKLDMNRSSVYSCIEALVAKWVVVDYEKNNVKYFKAIEPEDFLELCEKRERQIKALKRDANTVIWSLKKLKEKQMMPTFELEGRIKYYEGLEAVSLLIEETLDIPGKEQLCFGLNEYHTKVHPDDWKSYTQKRVAKKIFVQSIQPDTSAALEYQSRDKKELRETRLVPADLFPSKCELNIIGDTIALFTTAGASPAGMKMKNKYMAEALRSLFMLANEKAQAYDTQVKKKKK